MSSYHSLYDYLESRKLWALVWIVRLLISVDFDYQAVTCLLPGQPDARVNGMRRPPRLRDCLRFLSNPLYVLSRWRKSLRVCCSMVDRQNLCRMCEALGLLSIALEWEEIRDEEFHFSIPHCQPCFGSGFLSSVLSHTHVYASNNGV